MKKDEIYVRYENQVTDYVNELKSLSLSYITELIHHYREQCEAGDERVSYLRFAHLLKYGLGLETQASSVIWDDGFFSFEDEIFGNFEETDTLVYVKNIDEISEVIYKIIADSHFLNIDYNRYDKQDYNVVPQRYCNIGHCGALYSITSSIYLFYSTNFFAIKGGVEIDLLDNIAKYVRICEKIIREYTVFTRSRSGSFYNRTKESKEIVSFVKESHFIKLYERAMTALIPEDMFFYIFNMSDDILTYIESEMKLYSSKFYFYNILNHKDSIGHRRVYPNEIKIEKK